MKFLFPVALIVALTLSGTAVAAEKKRDWLILKSTEKGQPVIVRSLAAIPDPKARALRPWRLTVEWHYQKNEKGLPTEASIQKAREIEDGLYTAMEKVGEVDLPIVKTGNGVRTWLYYVSDAEKAGEPIRVFLKQRPDLTVLVKAKEDVDWLALKEVVENVRR